MIRSAILKGNVDDALELIEAHFPNVLFRTDVIHFQLCQQKFIEFMAQAASNYGHDVNEQDLMVQTALSYAQTVAKNYEHDQRPYIKAALSEMFGLFAYKDPHNSVMSHLLEKKGRIALAEEINAAILVSLGQSRAPALLLAVEHTSALIRESVNHGITEAGVVNISRDLVL